MRSQFYIKANRILDNYEKTKSFKNSLYNTIDSKDEYFKKLYCLCIEVIKHNTVLSEMITSEITDEDMSTLNMPISMIKILLYELYLSDKKFKMGGRVIKILKSKGKAFTDIISKYNIGNKSSKTSKIYFRILSYPIKEDNKLGELKQKMNDIAVKDTLIKGLYLLNEKNNTYDENKNILFQLKDMGLVNIQSKSSCLPVYILRQAMKYLDFDLEDDYSIVDSCSAPGNKTLQAADYFGTNIFAFEKNLERYNQLLANISQYTSTITPINSDFLLADPSEDIYKNSSLFICDPSCSGSGTLNSSLENNELSSICSLHSETPENQKERVKLLSSFQSKIIEHAMSFRNAKLIVYSTCSIYEEENEKVVEKVLSSEIGKLYKLANIHSLLSTNLKSEETFHKGKSKITANCLRACKLCHDLDGFFVALFQRIE